MQLEVEMKIIECLTESPEELIDILAVAGEQEFMLLLSKDKESSDYLTVYFNDEEVLEGARAKEVLEIIENAEFDLPGDALKIYKGFISALQASA